MNFWALSGLINGVVSSIFGLFVYLKNRQSSTNVQFGIFSFTVALWSYSYFFWQISTRESHALFWVRALMAGAIFIPITTLHFLLVWLGLYRSKKKILLVAYGIGSTFFGLIFTTHFIKDLVPILSFKYWPQAGVAFLPFIILWSSIVLYCWYIMIYAVHTTSPPLRNQIKYVFLSTIIGFCGGFTNYPLWYGIKIPPYGSILVSVYVGLMAYAVIRHQLMDIDVLIKKTVVFTSSFAVAFGVFVGITVLTQELIAGGRLLGLAISSAVIIFAVRPLEDFLIKVTDKFLFQKKYDYRHLIGQFMGELKTMVLNAGDIAQSTLDFLNSSIRPDNSVIFMHNNFTNKYDIIASVDFHDKNFKLPDNALFIEKLREAGEIVNLKRNKSFSDRELKELEAMGIHLIVPLIIHKELLGILGLGKKKSDEEYAEEDIDALSNLSGTLSIAINNAQLFDERADAEKRAMIGTLATGINHEIGNPLNVIAIKLQSFQLLSQRGLLEKKSKEEIIDEVNAITKICLESTKRIADITKKVSEFAKPDKKLALDNVNIVEAINETLAVLEHELVLDRIKLDKNIVCESPYVMADRGQLKQILFNLIKNAAQAIQAARRDGGKIVIGVDRHGEQEISLKISDNGHGIPKKDLDKIFMPFYTTKEPGKGTGLGLALVSRLVERNDAKIEIKSEEGKGTTFTLIFKRKPYG